MENITGTGSEMEGRAHKGRAKNKETGCKLLLNPHFQFANGYSTLLYGNGLCECVYIIYTSSANKIRIYLRRMMVGRKGMKEWGTATHYTNIKTLASTSP